MRNCPVQSCERQDIHVAAKDGSWHAEPIGPTILYGELITPNGVEAGTVLVVELPDKDEE